MQTLKRNEISCQVIQNCCIYYIFLHFPDHCIFFVFYGMWITDSRNNVLRVYLYLLRYQAHLCSTLTMMPYFMQCITDLHYYVTDLHSGLSRQAKFLECSRFEVTSNWNNSPRVYLPRATDVAETLVNTDCLLRYSIYTDRCAFAYQLWRCVYTSHCAINN